jgi:hypothetical protein
VRRTTGPWTPALHALLDHLAAPIPHTPRVLGFDDAGREILDYLPGRVIDVQRELPNEAQIDSVVPWTSSFHEAVSDISHDGPRRRGHGQSRGSRRARSGRANSLADLIERIPDIDALLT